MLLPLVIVPFVDTALGPGKALSEIFELLRAPVSTHSVRSLFDGKLVRLNIATLFLDNWVIND